MGTTATSRVGTSAEELPDWLFNFLFDLYFDYNYTY